ncbi:PREDICTED: F-box/FBD/LRR-repeat protein At1g13570-like [Fragaria vesca subsp. vesca]
MPSDVRVKISSSLPIRDAVRTSVLSTNWRYISAMLPHLVFYAHSISTLPQKFANAVDHVLLSHIGPVYKFKLAPKHICVRDFDRWILYVSRNSIKEFILEILGQPYYKLPSSMFLCRDLTHLELHKCLLQPPSTFTGFKSLKTLKIVWVRLTGDALQNMIAHCPLLERLVVEDCDDFNQLNINAPSLQVLRFIGGFKYINLLNTSNIVDVYIELYQFACKSSNLLRFFAQLPNIHRLCMKAKFTKYLADSCLPLEKLPKPCSPLQFLSLRIGTDYDKDILLCILRMCPALEELEVFASNYKAIGGKVNSWVDEHHSCSNTQLGRVKIHCSFPEVDGALELIRFLLLSSPALETMTLCTTALHPFVSYNLATKLLGLWRASLNLEMILNDNVLLFPKYNYGTSFYDDVMSVF